MKLRRSAEPAATLVRLSSLSLAVVIIFIAAATIFGPGSFLGLGQGRVCVDAPIELARSGDATVAVDLREGVKSSASVVTLCDVKPAAVQYVLKVLAELPALALFVLALILMLRLVRLVEHRENSQRLRMAAILRTLGWVLAAGGVMVECLESWASVKLFSTLVSYSVGAFSWISQIELPIWYLFVGLGLVSFSKVVAINDKTLPER